jgi:hypothetical protein
MIAIRRILWNIMVSWMCRWDILENALPCAVQLIASIVMVDRVSGSYLECTGAITLHLISAQ